MDTNKDYYAILGVLPFARKKVISKAYKVLAQHYHPDRFDGPKEKEEANHRMTEINEAYSVLSHRSKKEEYDKIRKLRFSDSIFRDFEIDKPPVYDSPEKNLDREFSRSAGSSRPNESLILVVLGILIFLAIIFERYFDY